MNKLEAPEIVKITKKTDEGQGITTIFFDRKIDAKPGQFVMIWIPGLDEKPFAVSHMEKESFSITVAAVGAFSNRLCSMKAGDKVGVRGPYGASYKLEGKKVAMVGGGYGVVPLALLAEEAAEKGIVVTFINGARTKDRVIYEKQLKKTAKKLIIATDDGSYGIKGRATDVLEELLKKEKIDKVFACGPEIMLEKVADMCVNKGIKGEISIERYFKCGYGLCGQCCIDPLGIRVCTEGPVIDVQVAQQLTEFGNYHRLKSGKREKIH